MNIDGKTQKYGLIGNPVEHSVSPMIHNFLADKMKQNMVYSTFQVNSEDLGNAIDGAHALKIQGLNVTVPYKTEVMKLLSTIEEDAKIIGAVNTLVYQNEGYHGRNTDYEGLYLAMKSDGIDISNEHIIILGAGGAARAAVYMCMKYSDYPIYILNRTKSKAEKLASEMNQFFNRTQVTTFAMNEYKEIPEIQKGYVAIQTTSVGLYPNIYDVVIEEEDFYKLLHTGYDVIYNPVKTEFMNRVESVNGKSYNGLKMLLYQGILAYETWRNLDVPGEISNEVLKKMKEELHEKA